MKPNVHIWVQACLYPESTPFGVWGYRILKDQETPIEGTGVSYNTSLSSSYIQALTAALQHVNKSSIVLLHNAYPSVSSFIYNALAKKLAYQNDIPSSIGDDKKQLAKIIIEKQLVVTCMPKNPQVQPELSTNTLSEIQKVVDYHLANSVHLWVSTTPQKGTWACIIQEHNAIQELCGQEPIEVYPHGLELIAINTALHCFSKKKDIIIHSTSQYIHKGIKEYLPKIGHISMFPQNQVMHHHLWCALQQHMQHHKISCEYTQATNNPFLKRAKQINNLMETAVSRVWLHFLPLEQHNSIAWGAVIHIFNKKPYHLYGTVTGTQMTQDMLNHVLKTITESLPLANTIDIRLNSEYANMTIPMEPYKITISPSNKDTDSLYGEAIQLATIGGELSTYGTSDTPISEEVSS